MGKSVPVLGQNMCEGSGMKKRVAHLRGKRKMSGVEHKDGIHRGKIV